MALHMLRAGVGALLGASGALMVAASWFRWAGACPWGEVGSGRCLERQDHRYDFIAPTAPWEPVPDAAPLAGASFLVLALAFLFLPWALTGRRPGVVSGAALVGVVLAFASVGTATLRSGLAGSVVPPIAEVLVGYGWFLVPPVLLIGFAVASRGWMLGASVFLVLATPLVAAFSYAIGPYDAQPWWEAYSGLLTAAAGLCLLVDVAVPKRFSRHETAVALAETRIPAEPRSTPS